MSLPDVDDLIYMCNSQHDQIKKLQQQRDELLAACEAAIMYGRFNGTVEEKVAMKLYEAIKKAKGTE